MQDLVLAGDGCKERENLTGTRKLIKTEPTLEGLTRALHTAAQNDQRRRQTYSAEFHEQNSIV